MKYWMGMIVAGLTVSTAQAGLVQAYWAPDTSRTAEKNLYELLGMADNAAVNTGTGGKQITDDQQWSTQIGGQYTSLLVEQAGNRNYNSFGVYAINTDGTVGEKLEIFPGPANPDPFYSKNLLINGSELWIGSNTIETETGLFGFYLQVKSGGYFYSETTRNSGGVDQMVTFDVNDTQYAPNAGWIIAWEDIAYNSSDKDFNDMIVSLTTAPIPEPGTVIAGVLLLLPFAASTLRALRRKTAA